MHEKPLKNRVKYAENHIVIKMRLSLKSGKYKLDCHSSVHFFPQFEICLKIDNMRTSLAIFLQTYWNMARNFLHVSRESWPFWQVYFEIPWIVNFTDDFARDFAVFSTVIREYLFFSSCDWWIFVHTETNSLRLRFYAVIWVSQSLCSNAKSSKIP